MDAGEAIFAREERDMSPGCWTATAGLSVNCVWPSVLIEILTPPQRLLHCSLCQHVLVGRPIDHNNDLVVDVVLEEGTPIRTLAASSQSQCLNFQGIENEYLQP